MVNDFQTQRRTRIKRRRNFQRVLQWRCLQWKWRLSFWSLSYIYVLNTASFGDIWQKLWKEMCLKQGLGNTFAKNVSLCKYGCHPKILTPSIFFFLELTCNLFIRKCFSFVINSVKAYEYIYIYICCITNIID